MELTSLPSGQAIISLWHSRHFHDVAKRFLLMRPSRSFARCSRHRRRRSRARDSRAKPSRVETRSCCEAPSHTQRDEVRVSSPQSHRQRPEKARRCRCCRHHLYPPAHSIHIRIRSHTYTHQQISYSRSTNASSLFSFFFFVSFRRLVCLRFL